MAAIMAAPATELAAVPDVGGVTADAVALWCQQPENQAQ
nr:hypothetical protein [Tanacetum cinerariifolium]